MRQEEQGNARLAKLPNTCLDNAKQMEKVATRLLDDAITVERSKSIIQDSKSLRFHTEGPVWMLWFSKTTVFKTPCIKSQSLRVPVFCSIVKATMYLIVTACKFMVPYQKNSDRSITIQCLCNYFTLAMFFQIKFNSSYVRKARLGN